jgi:predicted AAA+ superfamily ATPase
MWNRLHSPRLRALARQFPAVLILGPRQVGKTTLTRAAFPQAPYLDLEQPGVRQLFTADPLFQIESRLPGKSGALVLDEVQCVPEIFAALRGLIDRDRRRNGRFILLGSAQSTLIRQVSESLAGRVGMLELDPLTVAEVAPGTPKRAWTDLWLRGGFPDALRGNFREWWEAYLRTYLERDLPQLGVRADALFLRRLLTMLAHAQGGMLNASSLGASLGVSHHTIARHLDILEQTFLIRRLPPFFRNVGKRLVKAPKVYLRDSGLLHHLLNLGTLDEVRNHPVHGASWETFVLEDVIRREKLRHPHAQFFFWRTADGAEIDLVVERGSARVAVEIKAGRGDKIHAARVLERAMNDVGAKTGWILDQAEGTDMLRPGLARRSFAADPEWLP